MTEYLGLDEIGLVGCTKKLNKTKQRVCILQVPITVHLWVQGVEKGQKPVKRRKRRKLLEWELVINLATSYWGTGENSEDSLNRVQAGQTESRCTLPSIAVVLWFYTWPRLPSFQPLCSRGSFEFRGWLYYSTVPHPHKVQHPLIARTFEEGQNLNEPWVFDRFIKKALVLLDKRVCCEPGVGCQWASFCANGQSLSRRKRTPGKRQLGGGGMWFPRALTSVSAEPTNATH